jgi:ribonuclease P protein component
MLPKEKRLIETRDFKRVYTKGSFFSVPLFNLNFMSNRSQLTRVGIVISKKIAKRAVDRNRAKRQFREAVRSFYEILPKGYDIIISVKEKALGASYGDIEAEIKKAFERVGKK